MARLDLPSSSGTRWTPLRPSPRGRRQTFWTRSTRQCDYHSDYSDGLLGVLQTANLVTVRRVGRRKLHYLNPAPIQLVLERWFVKYARPTAAAGARPATAAETRAVLESARPTQDATRNRGAGER
jgi:hypothetical protein